MLQARRTLVRFPMESLIFFASDNDYKNYLHA
jgi:hypothetical protein